jgi:hypothetical protein
MATVPYGPDEIRPLTDENIKSLAESDYFGFMRQGGKRSATWRSDGLCPDL